MKLGQINTVSFYGRKNIQSLRKELEAKDARIKQLEKENQALKKQQAEDSWQKSRERDVAQRTMIEDLGSLWDD